MFVLGSFCYKSIFCDTDSTTQPFCVCLSLCVGRVNVHMYVPVCIEIKCHHCTQKNLCVCLFTCVISMGMMYVYVHVPTCAHVCDLWVWCVSMGIFLRVHMCLIYGYDVCLCVPMYTHVCNLWVWCVSMCIFMCECRCTHATACK